MVQTSKEVATISLQNTTDLLAGHDVVERGQGVVRPASGAATKRAREQVRRREGVQHLAVLFWRARSHTVGIPIGRFAALPGWGLHPLRTGGGGYPGGWLCRSPSCYPGQVRHALGDAGSIDARCTALVPVAEMVSQPVAGKMVGERGERALRFPARLRCDPFQCWCHGRRPAWLGVQHVSPPWGGTVLPLPGACSAAPFPCTRLSRAPSTLSPSDFLRLVTRDGRGARLSRRYRSSVSAVSEAAGSPTSTKVPLSACGGSEPRKSQHRLTLERVC